APAPLSPPARRWTQTVPPFPGGGPGPTCGRAPHPGRATARKPPARRNRRTPAPPQAARPEQEARRPPPARDPGSRAGPRTKCAPDARVRTNPPAPPRACPRRWARALHETTPAPPRPTPAPMKWGAAYGLYAAMFVIVFSEWPVLALEAVGWSPPPKLTGDVTLDNAASAAAWHWSTHAVLVLVVLGI